MYSKYVENIYWNILKRKCIWLVLITLISVKSFKQECGCTKLLITGRGLFCFLVILVYVCVCETERERVISSFVWKIRRSPKKLNIFSQMAILSKFNGFYNGGKPLKARIGGSLLTKKELKCRVLPSSILFV